ncbi:TonB-dependent receptor [uncultured Tenacibaculum sp.]|uniref:TonB-dependent receptor n=1 Tax=uncultured Tenacibaculum sp. TaxID=174713 RepID=UPI002604F105|nr:TonB-dependent receptor [uncultured Tenacibaculum sp.]
MSKKNTKIHFILFFACLFYFLTSYSQNKKQLLLSDALNIISNKHKVFFTYNPVVIKDQKVEVQNLQKLPLNQSIELLKKLTSYKIDYLGNNYYVLYASIKNKYYTNQKSLYNTQLKLLKDSINKKEEEVTVRGIVLNQYYQPIKKVNIIESNTQNGTISRNDGSFELKLLINNPIIFTHIGYKTEIVQTKNKFLRVLLKSGIELDEILIVGSRNNQRKKVDSPVSTDVIEIDNIKKKSEFLEVNQFIQNEIPSFNATKQSGSDGADHIVPATYRGLGPDQTLVLINGKRRHQASLINLYGTRGRGNSGTDLNAIPASAIKRIEVLKDGASAQYGSDAIAGVINIVLKDNVNQTNINSTVGFYNANNNSDQSKKGIDGFTYKADVNYGTKINKNGFVNVSAEFLSKDHTFRNGTNVRQKYGDAALKSSNLFINSEIPISPTMRAYTNGGYSFKNTEAYAFTRTSDSERNIISIYPNGFNPMITSNISDKSFTLGLKGKLKGWNIDFSNTYGKNNFHYFIKETLNATLLDKSPKEFDAGGHSLSQNTTNFDISKYFRSTFKGLNIALGLENRIESYKIFAGEEGSYASYDLNGNIVNSNTPINQIPTLNNKIRPGGSQGFPGYSPLNKVNRNRTSFSLYFDSEIDFSKKWLLTTAFRYENYSDFGNTINTKIATRFKVTSTTNLRASFSTGFRAPSLAQIYYNLKFTNYIDNKPVESFLIANNNPITNKFGIKQLKEEKAVNYSLGISHKASKNLQFFIDSYYIFIKDRIILSGNFDASSIDPNVQNVQFFANGVNTSTYGLDFKLNWCKKFTASKLFINFSGNFNKMKITRINNKDLDLKTFFGAREQYFLLASAPKHKLILNAIYSNKNISLSSSITRFSSLRLLDWQINKPLSDFNNSPEERLSASIDDYDAKYTLDSHFSYKLSKNYSIQIGVNNLFNTYPTQQGGNTDSGGLWDAVQMGSNGAFYYSKFSVNF